MYDSQKKRLYFLHFWKFWQVSENMWNICRFAGMIQWYAWSQATCRPRRAVSVRSSRIRYGSRTYWRTGNHKKLIENHKELQKIWIESFHWITDSNHLRPLFSITLCAGSPPASTSGDHYFKIWRQFKSSVSRSIAPPGRFDALPGIWFRAGQGHSARDRRGRGTVVRLYEN